MSESYEQGREFLKANWHLLSDGWISDQSRAVPAPEQEEPPNSTENVIRLVPSEELSAQGRPFLDLIRARKSRRKFNPYSSLNLQELSLLCWAAAGIKERKSKYSFRTYPSGGARHPFDLFVFLARVEGCTPGLYRYLPFEHALALVREGDDSAALNDALMGQYWSAAAVFVWAAVPYRTEWRYGPVSHKIIALDAGHACQNLYLACESLGAGTCAIGAYDQQKLDTYLGLDGKDRFAIYAAPIGKE